MSGLSVAPSDSVQPQKTGSHAPSPAEKLKLLPHLCQPLLPFLWHNFWYDTFWSGAGFYWSCLKGVGVGGRQQGGVQPTQKSRKENEHFTFNCSPFGNSFPATQKGSRQTDIAGVLSPFSSSIVKLICSGIVLDAGCHVSYWLFSSRSKNTHPEPWWNNEGGMQPQRSGTYNSGHAILHL